MKLTKGNQLRSGWKTGVLIGAGFFMGVFASDSEGGPRIPQGAGNSAMKGQAAAQAASHQQLVQAIQVLQSVKITLEKADHDYGGHRATAVKEIAQAEHQLLRALHTHMKNLGIQNPNAGKGPTMKEAQALSDAQLQQTIPVLSNTITVLGNANHDFGGHRQKAIVDLQAAIKQLDLALKFSKQHDQNKKVVNK